jgi:hypothetical protein
MLSRHVLPWYLACLLGTALGSQCKSSAPTVKINAGMVVGTTTTVAGATATVSQFLGVPFAAPPTRFVPPTRATPWPTPLQATAYGPACPQQFNYPDELREVEMAWFNTPPPSAGESEDCLNLNIYVPGTPGKNKAVMVWIYARFIIYMQLMSLTLRAGWRVGIWLEFILSIRWGWFRRQSGCHRRDHQLPNEQQVHDLEHGLRRLIL